MIDSATPTLREQKKRRTAATLTSACRRLTAERGLAGFTIEEACAEVDVSRRTFFNYFATKEDAVIGVDPEDESRRFTETFLARDSRGWAGVLDDLVELVVEHFETAGPDLVDHGEFMQAIEREPRLLVRFMGATRDRERQAMAMIAEREGVDTDDPRAEAVVGILNSLMRSTGDRLLDPATTLPFSAIISESLAAYRSVLAPTQPRKDDL